jgi:hypothetical protein
MVGFGSIDVDGVERADLESYLGDDAGARAGSWCAACMFLHWSI